MILYTVYCTSCVPMYGLFLRYSAVLMYGITIFIGIGFSTDYNTVLCYNYRMESVVVCVCVCVCVCV